MNKEPTYTNNEGKQVPPSTMIERTEIQLNNRLLAFLVGILAIWTLMALWLIYYVLRYNVVGNVLKVMGSC